MKLISKFYSDIWEDSYDLVFNEENGRYYLAANDETNFLTFGKVNFKFKGDDFVHKLAEFDKENTPGTLIGLYEHKTVLCYLFKEGNRYALRPALRGDETEVKTMYQRIGTKGEELDFRRVICHGCKCKYYYKDGPYKIGFKYEVKCPKCKHVQRKERKELSYDA